MLGITNILSFSGSITAAEVSKATINAELVLADSVLYKAYKKKYSMNRTLCGQTDSNAINCLYLYLYAINTYNFEGDNYLNEEQLTALLVNIEQISKSCCNE